MSSNSNGESPNFNQLRKRQVAYLGFVFFVVFTAFNLTQALITSIFASVGSFSLAILYISFALGSLIIPFITFKFGSKFSLILGSFGYFMFVLGAASKKEWFLLIGCVFCGSGGALIWIGQGVYLSEVSGAEQSALGALNAVFWTICNLNMIPGPLISGFLVKSGTISISILLWIQTAISFLACILMVLIKRNTISESDTKSQEKPSVIKILSEFKDLRVILLLSCFTFQGFSITFTFGVFPTLMQVNEVPFVFLTYGISSLIGAYLSGICLDRFGWKPVSFAAAFLYSLGYIIAFIGKWKGMFSLFYITGLCVGLVDAEINTKINWFIMRIYENSSPSYAFAAYRFTMAASCALGFIVSPFIPFFVLQIIVIVFLLISTVCYFIIDRKFLQQTKKEQQQFEDTQRPQVQLEES